MIGRGTRLCPDLFGPGEHKKEFLIFDYCQNFEFFDEYPDGATARNVKPLMQQIFEASCGGGSCHIETSTNGVRLNSYSNVINSQGAQYGELVVQPGDADGSPLVDKIEPNPQFGTRMPQTGDFLSDERIDQIRTWINEGAQDN